MKMLKVLKQGIQYFQLFLIPVLLLFINGCEDPLQVENPNKLVEEDLDNPAAASAIANGALATCAQGMAYVLAPYEDATDEVTWIGSRDAWRQLNFGIVTDINNEFVDNAFKFIAEGRWMADKAVSQLEKFSADGTLENPVDLARSYLYAAFIRVYIADFFDDFAFSDRRDPGPAIGEDQMFSLYDQAIELLTKGLNIAQTEGDVEHQRRILAMRARAKHAKAIWNLLNPKGSIPTDPFVDAGTDDAAAALELMDSEWKWDLQYDPTQAWNDLAWQINGRKELAIVTPLATDPIDGITDPRMQNIANNFTNKTLYGDAYSPVTVVSAREMHLIIAEGFIARGNLEEAKNEINAVRALDNLTLVTNQDVKEILIHERRANLFLQGKRLQDMYRFGIIDKEWQDTSDAVRTPGSFFPITISERLANPLIPISD